MLLDQSDVIPYTEAINRKPKTGRYCYTWVSWEGAPENWIRAEFETVGLAWVAGPVEDLPTGYAMLTHATNKRVWAWIYDETKLKTADFDYLDKVSRDYELLYKVTKGMYGDLFLYELRPDYREWSVGFSDAWDTAIEALDATFEKAINKCYPDLDETKGVGCRTMPPDYKTLIKQIAEKMIAIADDI